MTDEDLNEVYGWVDKFDLSRPKRNIARDFSDGLMVAEIVKTQFDRLVDVHNYPSTHNVKQKYTNWDTLNSMQVGWAGKVLSKLGIQAKAEEIDRIVNCKPDAVEMLLLKLKKSIEETKARPPGAGVDRRRNDHDTPGSYTNIISPIDTPTMMIANNQFQMPLVQMGAQQFMPQMAHHPQHLPMPPDTPVSKVPKPSVNERRRTLCMI